MQYSLRATLLAAIIVGAAAGAALAQEWPAQYIKLIVPFAPGGGVDFVARVIADKLGPELGQSVIVDNRPGASSTIGSSAVANAKPDGYTLLFTNMHHAAIPVLRKTLPYDTFKDFDSVSMVAALPTVLLVPANSKANSVSDLIALSKRDPGKLNYSSAGFGSINFLAAELFKKQAGLNIAHIPYQGGGPAMTALLSGQVEMLFITVPPALPHIKAGKVKALAVTSVARSALLPDIPTVAEAGYPELGMVEVFGIRAPAGTPKPTIKKLNVAINKVLADPAVKSRLEEAGVNVAGSSPEQFTSYLQDEISRWDKVVTPEMRTDE